MATYTANLSEAMYVTEALSNAVGPAPSSSQGTGFFGFGFFGPMSPPGCGFAPGRDAQPPGARPPPDRRAACPSGTPA